MIGFLKIVAAFFVAIVIFVVLVIVVIRWKLKKFLKSMVDTVTEAATKAVPPFRISLQPKDDDEQDDDGWIHKDDVERLTTDFEAAGFTQIGDFDAEGLPLELRAFQHQDHQIYGVLYDHAMAGCWCDIVRRYADESAWTVSSAKEHGMDPPPNHHPTFLPGRAVSDLVDKLLEVSPKEGLQKAGADMFAQRFEAAYSREMNWRIERGGPTEGEIRRIASNGGEECSENNIEQIQNMWRTAIAEFLSERALRTWRKESGIPGTEYRRMAERLFVVHERMLPEQLLEFADEELPYEDDTEDKDVDSPDGERDRLLVKIKQWCSEDSLISAFRKLLNECKVDSDWKQLAEVSKPVRAQIWERLDDDDADFDDNEAMDDDGDDDPE